MRDNDAVLSRLTRRELVAGALAGGLSLGVAGLAAGCGSSAGASSTPSAGGRPKRGGSLRIGATGGGAKDSIDAHQFIGDPNAARIFQLYEPLALRDADFRLEMLVAESIEPAGRADLWTVRLRPGILFSDGRPVTADDVIYTIRRIVDPADPKIGAASLSGVDTGALKKIDPRTVQIKLKTPNAAFPDFIGQDFNGIVPVGYDPKSPVGTGPFKYASFTPGQQSVFVRNPHYWRSGEPYVDQVVIIDFADDTARMDALTAGQVDAITNVPAADRATVMANAQLSLLNSQTGNWQPFVMRVDQPPFSDVRVRQAFRLIVNRPQIIEQALDGQGRVANDLYSPYDPGYASDLPQRHQDLAQAKALLKQAGHDGLTVELVTAPVFEDLVPAAQVFQQQARGAGVTVNIRTVDSTTFFGPSYLKWTFTQDYWFTRDYLGQVTQDALPSSPFNETHWNDPQFTKLIAQAQATLDAAKRNELLREAQTIEYERGGYIVWSFSNQIDGYSTKVAGFHEARSGVPLTNYGFRSVWFT